MDSFMLRGVFCLLAVCVLSSAARGRSDVLELKDADFDYIAPEHETLLVKFYAPCASVCDGVSCPWYLSTAVSAMQTRFLCGHCKKLAPEFETAATRLKGTVTLAKVDCTADTEICKRYGVTGYPTLKIFRNGQESSSYDGPRSADGIVNYMKKQAGPDSVPLHSEHDLENFINNFDASIVGFFSGTDSSQLSEFLKGASLMRESFRFAHTTDLELGKKYDVKYESVLLFRPPRLSSKFEESVVHHKGPLSITGLRRFIRDNIFGLCPHLTKENKDTLRKRDLLTAYYDLDYLRNPKGSNYWRNRVLKVASKFSSQGLLFSVANRNDFLEELEDEYGLGTSDTTEVPFVTIRTRTGNKYTMREEFTRDGKSLENFLEDYFAERLKRYIKSEPVPAKNNGAVKVVVADTFEEIVNDPEKDVLIEFYAPWCGHCKKLEPKYTELGERLYSDPNIVIAKMDATANDIPQGYDVQGFPTIYFAAAGRKDEPKRYEVVFISSMTVFFIDRFIVPGPKLSSSLCLFIGLASYRRSLYFCRSKSTSCCQRMNLHFQPTCLINAANTQSRVVNGAREVKDFINFLKREASKPLVLNGVKEEL
ncbi:Protein disulfide-isomerase A3 [Labeo rohita]|uniref:protein disulfide-isomerase n=1 Tax=Labeo rohita TaxID=84645 RepID=A0ABQ8LPT1_LABRO|nr:Protein disulfide-isomerase A3 [Labeo rohita]